MGAVKIGGLACFILITTQLVIFTCKISKPFKPQLEFFYYSTLLQLRTRNKNQNNMDSETFADIGKEFTAELADLYEMPDNILNSIPYDTSGEPGQIEQDMDLMDFLNGLDDMNYRDDRDYLANRNNRESLDDLDTVKMTKKAGLTFLKFNPGVERGKFTSAYQFCLQLRSQTQN